MQKVLRTIGILSILATSACTSLVYIKPEIPELNLTTIQAPDIPNDSDMWNSREFLEMTEYASKLEIQIDAYKQYIKEIGK